MKKVKSAIASPVTFLHEAKEELDKVVWPDRNEVTSFTVVVIIAVIAVAMFLWFVDTGLVTLIKTVLN